MSWTKKQTEAIFGEKLYLKKYIYDYNSERAPIINDGYSFTVFKIPDNYYNNIIGKFPEIRKYYPQNKNFREKWMIEGWKETPIKDFENNVFKFVINSLPVDNEKGKYYYEYFIKKIKEEGNYYCYFYYINNDRDWISDIDFYLFIPDDQIIIMINHLT
jgi:hypothetical protein